MDDRELLERAAKAAGLTYRDDLWNGGHARNPDGLWVAWNPLEDDGDALRLAVRLRLSVKNTEVRASVIVEHAGRWVSATEPHGDDPAAATRRAIVRAAAAIGEQHG